MVLLNRIGKIEFDHSFPFFCPNSFDFQMFKYLGSSSAIKVEQKHFAFILIFYRKEANLNVNEKMVQVVKWLIKRINITNKLIVATFKRKNKKQNTTKK